MRSSIPIDRPDAAPQDSGADAAPNADAQVGRDAALGTPVYGIPTDPRDSGASVCDAGSAEDLARRPARDGGADGGEVCPPPPDAGRPTVVPVYGTPVDLAREKR